MGAFLWMRTKLLPDNRQICGGWSSENRLSMDERGSRVSHTVVIQSTRVMRCVKKSGFQAGNCREEMCR